MNNYKSPYDSTQIREGLMNIKQSQMQLLRQLKNQNHLLKKYTPENPIYQQKSESNFYQSSSPSYSIKQNFQSNLGSNSKPNYESYLSSNQKDFVDTVKLNSKNENTHTLERQLQAMTEEFHRMKKNYFNEKQKNKDMVLHMEFAASLHNLILKEVLQGGNLQSIKSKVRSEVQSYQSEFPEFKAFGLQQAFNIVNLQSDIPFAESRVTNRRTQIFQPKMSQQNTQLLKQLNDLKCQLRQISLQKQRKTQQVTLMRSQNDYTVSLLNKELQMKNGKINELVSQILKQKESLNYLNSQNSDLKSNIDRLKGQLQRNFNKIELLQSQQRKTTQTIQKQHKYMKYLKELQDKVSFLERQSREKSKLIQIHQQNVSKYTQQAKSFKNDTQRLKSQLSDTKQSLSKKTTQIMQLQQKLDSMTVSHSQKLTLINKRNQTQQYSLKQHIQQLKKNLQILLKQQESYKLSQQALLQIKQKKIQNIKLSKTVDHLWKIKEVEYQNINTVLTQLNLIKSVNEAHYIGQNAYQLKKQPVSARNDGSKVKSSSKSKEKHRRR